MPDAEGKSAFRPRLFDTPSSVNAHAEQEKDDGAVEKSTGKPVQTSETYRKQEWEKVLHRRDDSVAMGQMELSTDAW
jgi:hypothetical protein